MTDHRSGSAQKRFREKPTEVHFSIFIENRNWDLKFVFRFENEIEKQQQQQQQQQNQNSISFQNKNRIPFRPTDLQSVYGKYNSKN